MGLFNLSGKAKKKKTNSMGERLNKLTPEGEIPFGWMAYNQKTVNQIESELTVFRKKIHDAKTDIEKYAALKSYVLYIEDGKLHYGKMGKCEGKYFEEYVCESQETITNKKRFKQIEAKLLAEKR